MNALKKYYKVLAIPLFEDNYSYIVQGTAKKSLVLVDPANPPVILHYLQNNFATHIVSHILYTHKHWDHAGGSEELRN
jgi:glyoxylase-like metal-dependent hydrolase (beta-lactamase superfamily II)